MDTDDFFDGPLPCDPPEEEDLLDQVDAAIDMLAARLQREPDLRRADAVAFVKSAAPECSIFLSVIWPAARELAGLPRSAGKGGRPRKQPQTATP